MSIVAPDPDGKPDPSASWEEWREALAVALQGQYGTAKTWATVSEQARNGWRSDAADIMASLPQPPSRIPWSDEHSPFAFRLTGDAFCRICGNAWPCPRAGELDA